MPEKTKYILEMDEKQAVAVRTALEFYARILIGQWQEIGYQCLDFADKNYAKKFDELKEGLRKLRPIAFPELPPDLSASYGVGAVDKATIVWEVYEVLRHCIAWTKNPEGNPRIVDFGTPVSFSGHPLAKCTSKTEDKN